MSEEQYNESVNEQSKNHTLEVLRTMMVEVDNCFSEKTAEEMFEIKNFIDSFVREL